MPKGCKCPLCGKVNQKEDTIKIGARYYCVDCGEQVKAEKEEKKDAWSKLFDYICKINNIDKPTGMMFKQLKDFRNEPYNYTDEGMLATLQYYYDVLESAVKEGVGLGIIPYYYERTKSYYEDVYRVEDSLENEKEIEQKVISIDSNLLHNTKGREALEFTSVDWGEDIDNQ